MWQVPCLERLMDSTRHQLRTKNHKLHQISPSREQESAEDCRVPVRSSSENPNSLS